MTEEENRKRIEKIAKQQEQLVSQVKKAETGLFEMLLTYWTSLRESPALFRRLWKRFARENYAPLFEQFAVDIKTVVALNEEYFAATGSTERVKEIAKTVNKVIGERMGLDDAGKIIEGGYLDTLIQDQTAKRQVQQFFHKTRALKNETQLKVELKEMVKGVKDNGGPVNRLFDNYVYDTYQEADRVSQNEYAEKLGMEAFIYIGGVVDGSRPFCKERNGKIFLRSEIDLFGTPNDKFGGYTNKSQGLFTGKPKDVYDPFTQCGGYACRHHWGAIAKEFAVRKDKTLKIVDGELVRDGMPEVEEPKPKVQRFENAESVAKAQKWAKQNDLAGEINYKKATNTDIANRLNKVLFDSKQIYGVRYDKVFFSTMPDSPNAFAANKTVIDSATGKIISRQLEINSKRLAQLNLGGGIDQYIASKRANGWWAAESFEDIVNHEIGHYLTIPNTTRADYHAFVNEVKGVKIEISRYGATSGSEALAEIWSQYRRDGIDGLEPEWVTFFNKYSSIKIE